jgi:hypothetical protein
LLLTLAVYYVLTNFAVLFVQPDCTKYIIFFCWGYNPSVKVMLWMSVTNKTLKSMLGLDRVRNYFILTGHHRPLRTNLITRNNWKWFLPVRCSAISKLEALCFSPVLAAI